jgi:hypothetical protein
VHFLDGYRVQSYIRPGHKERDEYLSTNRLRGGHQCGVESLYVTRACFPSILQSTG